MRTMLPALAVLAGGLTIGPGAAKAEVIYPWCAQYGELSGMRNCGFATLEQCRAAISGNGGYCEQNQAYRPGVAIPPPARTRR
jgi:hypothetical protein